MHIYLEMTALSVCDDNRKFNMTNLSLSRPVFNSYLEFQAALLRFYALFYTLIWKIVCSLDQ